MNRYSSSPSYRKARNNILEALVGSLILFIVTLAVFTAALGSTMAGGFLFVSGLVVYVTFKVCTEG